LHLVGILFPHIVRYHFQMITVVCYVKARNLVRQVPALRRSVPSPPSKWKS